MESTVTQSITIRCNTKDLFDYVNKPRLWSKWNDQSLQASTINNDLRVGDRFKEKMSLQLFSALPFTLYQEPIYEVVEIYPNRKWVIHGKMHKSDIHISYEFQPITNKRTKFKQTLIVKTKGTEKVWHPLLHLYFKHTSLKALNKLKETCEIRF